MATSMRRTSVTAAWGLIALLVAIFPANIHMATHPAAFSEFSPAALWIRLLFQPLMIVWSYWFTRQPSSKPASSS